MEALIAKGITKRYTHHLALDNVSISIPEKTIFGLLGPNGAGKTTFIRIINQIINANSGETTTAASAPSTSDVETGGAVAPQSSGAASGQTTSVPAAPDSTASAIFK